MRMRKENEKIIKYLPDYLQNETLALLSEEGNCVNEIRLRVGRAAVAMFKEGHRYICKEKPLSSEDINVCFERVCDYSVYSRQMEISNGFVTLPGGSRVGICGTACVDKTGHRTVKNISSLNIRIANEFPGCSNDIIRDVFSDRVTGTLVAGPPCSGKTTLLKDFALKLSSSPFFRKTVIVDERDELAAMYRGEPSNTIGEFCDVLSGYPKGEGILNAVRTLSPEIIICDEIGNSDDVKAVCDVINAGVVIISSVHGCDADELYRRAPVRKLLKSGAFKKIVLLKGGDARCELDRIIEVDRNGI